MRLLVVVLAAVGCGGGSSSTASGPMGKRVGPALAGALGAADHLVAPQRCAAPDLPAAPDGELVVGKATWKLANHTLRGTATRIGVIADAGGAAPATLAALGRLRARLAKVELVIALGGMADTEPALGAILEAFAAHAPWPVIVIPGDLERVDDLARAIAAARAKGIPAIDGRAIQRVELAGATIALVGGGAVAERVVAGSDGCTFADPAAMFAELAAVPTLRITASWEPLAPPTDAIDVAVFGATDGPATPGRDGKRDGRAAALSPGSADATSRGEHRAPTAGILELADGGWTWRVVADTP